MTIPSSMVFRGVEYRLEYEDCDDFSVLPRELCTQVYGVCFVGDDILIAKNGKKNTWGLPGGTIEPDETIEETFRREIMEEANSEVLSMVPIGYQKVIAPDGSFYYQLRMCATVRQLGPFVGDPAGSITENAVINPDEHSTYFNWGAIGKRIIERGIELHKR